MTFIGELIEAGGHYILERTDSGASFRPVTGKHADLKAFQSLVRRIKQRAGEGFEVQAERVSDDHPGELVDLLVLRFDS